MFRKQGLINRQQPLCVCLDALRTIAHGAVGVFTHALHQRIVVERACLRSPPALLHRRHVRNHLPGRCACHSRLHKACRIVAVAGDSLKNPHPSPPMLLSQAAVAAKGPATSLPPLCVSIVTVARQHEPRRACPTSLSNAPCGGCGTLGIYRRACVAIAARRTGLRTRSMASASAPASSCGTTVPLALVPPPSQPATPQAAARLLPHARRRDIEPFDAVRQHHAAACAPADCNGMRACGICRQRVRDERVSMRA